MNMEDVDKVLKTLGSTKVKTLQKYLERNFKQFAFILGKVQSFVLKI